MHVLEVVVVIVVVYAGEFFFVWIVFCRYKCCVFGACFVGVVVVVFYKCF